MVGVDDADVETREVEPRGVPRSPGRYDDHRARRPGGDPAQGRPVQVVGMGVRDEDDIGPQVLVAGVGAASPQVAEPMGEQRVDDGPHPVDL